MTEKNIEKLVPNITVSIAGLPKTGKSHLALTFPEPIIVFSFDLGLEPVLAKFEGKKIGVKTYPIPIIDSIHPKPYAKPIWAQFTKDYKEAIWDKAVKTVVIDTGTALYELARHARTEELGQQQLLRHQYGEVYSRMSALYLEPRISGVNLVITHYTKDVYEDEKPTGEVALDGYKRTNGIADLVLTMARGQTRDKDGKPKTVALTTITDSRFGFELDGLILENTTYNELISLIGG